MHVYNQNIYDNEIIMEGNGRKAIKARVEHIKTIPTITQAIPPSKETNYKLRLMNL